MSYDILHLNEWFTVNKLKVNEHKMKIMVLSHHCGNLNNAELNATGN